MHGKVIIAIGSFFVIIFIIMLLSGNAAIGDNDTGYLLRYKMSDGQGWHYDVDVNENLQSILYEHGLDISSETNAKRRFWVNFIKEDTHHNLVTSVLIDEMSYIVKSGIGGTDIDFSKVKGKTFNLTFSRLGNELEYSGIENLNCTVNSINKVERTLPVKIFFENVFMDLPEKPVKIGDTWKTDVRNTSKSLNGYTSNIVYSVSYTLEGLEKRNNRNCLRLKMKTGGTLQSVGRERTGEIILNGEIEGTTLAYFDYRDGVLVGIASDLVTSGERKEYDGSKIISVNPFESKRKTGMILLE